MPKKTISLVDKALNNIEDQAPALFPVVDKAVPIDTNITKDTILALDVAEKTGFCTSVASGVWDFKVKRDESAGMRLIRFKSKLKELVTKHGINCVVFERSAGRYKGAIIVQSELHGVLKLFCEEAMIQYRAYSASEIKQFATGNGNAGKPAMVKAAEDRYGKKVKDDNEADAMHTYHLALKDFGLTERAF